MYAHNDNESVYEWRVKYVAKRVPMSLILKRLFVLWEFLFQSDRVLHLRGFLLNFPPKMFYSLTFLSSVNARSKGNDIALLLSIFLVPSNFQWQKPRKNQCLIKLTVKSINASMLKVIKVLILNLNQLSQKASRIRIVVDLDNKYIHALASRINHIKYRRYFWFHFLISFNFLLSTTVVCSL